MLPVLRRLRRRCGEIQSTTLTGDFLINPADPTSLAWFRFPRNEERDINHPDRPELENLAYSLKRVHDEIQMCIEAGISPQAIALIGHSQGGAMALAAGVTFDQPLGIVCCIAGYLALPKEYDLAPRGTPFFLLHARQDPVVTAYWAEVTRDWFLTRQYTCELRFDDFEVNPHGMHQRQISAIADRIVELNNGIDLTSENPAS